MFENDYVFQGEQKERDGEPAAPEPGVAYYIYSGQEVVKDRMGGYWTKFILRWSSGFDTYIEAVQHINYMVEKLGYGRKGLFIKRYLQGRAPLRLEEPLPDEAPF